MTGCFDFTSLSLLDWKDSLKVSLFLQDPRFNAEVDMITGYKTQSILCLPIKNQRDEVSAADTQSLTL